MAVIVLSNKVKLILGVDSLSPTLTGIGRYTWELATRLEKNPEIAQISYFRPGLFVREPSILINKKKIFSTSHVKVPNFLHKMYWTERSKNQVFHAPNFFLPSYVQCGVATVHDLSVFKFPETHPIERVRMFDKFFMRTLDIAQHLITPSETVRQEVIDYFNWPSHQITAVYNGVASDFYPRKSHQVSAVLKRYGLTVNTYTLCVSTIEPRKSIDRLIAAYAQLPKKMTSLFPLVLIGHKGWNSEGLHEQIETAQHAGWLHYLGFVEEKDLSSLYAGARLCVYPSIYEGFGLPVAEAMASGVPVITSNRSCLPEIADGAATLIDPDDISAFTLSLETALTDEVWRESAITKGLLVARKYTWDECIVRTVGVYQTLNH